jgi:PAS domain-containing protein
MSTPDTNFTELDRRRLEAILETTPSAIVLIEAADRRFSFVNQRALELYGRTGCRFRRRSCRST